MTLLSVLTLLAADAQAAWPDDVDLLGMTEHAGQPVVDPSVITEDYAQLIRELGMAVGTRSVMAAHTLGVEGFEVTLDTTMAFISTRGDADDPSPWQRAHVAEDPSSLVWQPGISVRKGLPFSIELGMSGRWMGQTRQGVVSGFVRAALSEGYKPWPDLNVHLGYTGYIGNDQLKLGVFDIGATLGTRAAVGPIRGVRNAAISPFVDVTLMVINSTPTIDAATYADIGAITYGNRGGDTAVTPNQKAIALPQFNGGFQFDVGRVTWRLSGGYGLRASAWAGTSLGLRY
jgi:hypothetical protein